MKVNRYVLKNGVRVVASPSYDTNSATILFMVKTGSRNEELRINGLSHFLEHMVFKGTKKRPTAFDISKEIEGLGAQSNAYTTKEYTAFYIKTIPSHFEKALEILTDVIFNPLIDEKEVALEKKVILEEKKMHEDNPQYYIGDLFEQVYFNDGKLAQNILGTEAAIKALQRKDFLAFQKKFYKSGNIVISVAGNIPKDYGQILDKFLGGIKKGKETDWLSKAKKSSKVKSLYKDIFQSNMIVGFPGVRYSDKNYLPLKILSGILGGGMSSRLFQEVREKRGLAYVIYSDVETYSDSGYLEIGLGTDTKGVEEALEVIKKELNGFPDSLKQEELKIAKERLKGLVSFEFENGLKRADFYAKREIYHTKLETLDQIIKNIDQAQLKELKVLAYETFSKKPTLAVIGPCQTKVKMSSFSKVEMSSFLLILKLFFQG